MTEPVRLSRVDRWVLSNQYKILAALHPQEARYYDECRDALESGYEGEYSRLVEHVFGDRDCLSAEECHEVVDILAMFRALKDTMTDGVQAGGFERWQIEFAGFDGNNEGRWMAYARYFCSSGPGAFTDLEKGDNFNSHAPMLDRYRRQLAEWRRSKTPYKIETAEVERIARAAIHPTMRDKR